MNFPKMMERNFCIRGARVVLMESIVGEVLMKKVGKKKTKNTRK